MSPPQKKLLTDGKLLIVFIDTKLFSVRKHLANTKHLASLTDLIYLPQRTI